MDDISTVASAVSWALKIAFGLSALAGIAAVLFFLGRALIRLIWPPPRERERSEAALGWHPQDAPSP
jgi:hypothetical protein